MHHVLIIEDDAVIRTAICYRALERNWRVTTLPDGRELQRMLLDEPADLLLVDIGLPHIDGLALIEALRTTGNAVPVLVITASERPGLQDHVTRAGADDLMLKPFDPDDLLHRMERLLAA